MTSLQSRILVAVIGVPVLLWVVLWAPPLVMHLMLAALSAIGAWELVNCAGSYKAWRAPAGQGLHGEEGGGGGGPGEAPAL